MTTSIIGKALVVAWSFTLTNLGPTPQIINLGPAPTDNTYLPIEEVIGLGKTPISDAAGLKLTLGTIATNPVNVYNYFNCLICGGESGSNYLAQGMWGVSPVPAGKSLYAEYSLPSIFPATDKPITIDILAYQLN